mgnify:CR=1 FL=1
MLLALLLGKAAQASERGIEFDIDLPDRLEATHVLLRTAEDVLKVLRHASQPLAARGRSRAGHHAIAHAG